jgi:hypothetical protein
MTQRPRVVDTSYTFVVTKKPKKAQKLPINRSLRKNYTAQRRKEREKGNMKANTSIWHIQCIRRVEKERSKKKIQLSSDS